MAWACFWLWGGVVPPSARESVLYLARIWLLRLYIQLRVANEGDQQNDSIPYQAYQTHRKT